MKTSFIIFFISILLFKNCINNNSQNIEISDSISEINCELIKVDFVLANNDTIDYFIPFLKPADIYSHLRYKDSTFLIKANIDVDFLLTNNLLSKDELYKTAHLDSIIYSTDTLVFFFEEEFVKNQYDKLLQNSKIKKLKYVYPYFYHAIGNGCVYLKHGDMEEITIYLYHSSPINLDSLKISFDFNTRKIDGYRSKYFKYIPTKIGSYKLFKGEIYM